MSLREACFLIGPGDAVLWSDASTRPVAMPDSRARWQAIWTRRDVLVEIAHTHPLGGLHFSTTDERTMRALNDALGRTLSYAVVTPTGMLRRDERGDREVQPEPWWTELIRNASGIWHGGPHKDEDFEQE